VSAATTGLLSLLHDIKQMAKHTIGMRFFFILQIIFR
jgi:hypothetical protein